MPATATTTRPQLKTPRGTISQKVAARREDKKGARALKLEITKWKCAKAMRRSMIGAGFFFTARAIADASPGMHFMDIVVARDAKYKGKELREVRKLVDGYVNSRVETTFGIGCLVNPENRIDTEADCECGSDVELEE